jgi:hypothetical protein
LCSPPRPQHDKTMARLPLTLILLLVGGALADDPAPPRVRPPTARSSGAGDGKIGNRNTPTGKTPPPPPPPPPTTAASQRDEDNTATSSSWCAPGCKPAYLRDGSWWGGRGRGWEGHRHESRCSNAFYQIFKLFQIRSAPPLLAATTSASTSSAAGTAPTATPSGS